MRRPRPAVLVGLLLAVLAAVLAWRSLGGAEQLRYYSPDAYVARADRFIAEGWLVADCSGPEPRLVPRLEAAPPAEAEWYRDSYLAADVERFNAEPESFGWAFALDPDCTLRGVDPAVHRIELPFARRARWLGRILYGGGADDAVLRSPRRTVGLRRPDRPVAARDTATTPVGGDETLVGEGVVLFHFGSAERPAARVWPVGSEVVVFNRVRPEIDDAVRLMGYRLQEGRRARLETGDWLDLSAENPRREETLVYVSGETRQAASLVRRRNDRSVRVTEDVGLGRVPDRVQPGGYPVLDLLVDSVDASLAALPEARAEELSQGFDLQMAVDRSLQVALTRRLADAAEEARDRAAPFSAGLTVMDGKTGELLALASYPTPEMLAEAGELDAASRRRLLPNQNLVRHPIGSAGKPFLFAAIAEAAPLLLDLELVPHPGEESRRDLFHCELPSGYQVGGAAGADGGRIGFGRALGVSSNRYTVELATLALAARAGATGAAVDGGGLRAALPEAPGVDWPAAGAGSGAWIAGRPLDYAPSLGEYLLAAEGESPPPEEPGSSAAMRCNAMDRLELAPFRPALEEITGAETYRGRAPRTPPDATRRQLERSYATARYDLRPWRPLLDHLTAGTDEAAGWAVHTAFQRVSPERVDLAFNRVSRLRQDYVSLLLGGATSTWTNVQLAEATSRLVAGRRVEARLAERVLVREDGDAVEPVPPEETELPAPLELRPEVRRAVLDGMAQVVEGPGGTGRELRDELSRLRAAFPGDRVLLYSKTGSPTLLRPVPRAAARALTALVARGRLRLAAGGGGLVVPAGGGAAAWPADGVADRGAARQALERALGEVGFAGAARRLARSLSPALDDFALQLAQGTPAGELEGPLRTVRGRLAIDERDPLFRRQLVRGRGAVYLFSLVRIPGGAGGTGVPTVEELAAPDVRIVTGALHLAIGPDSRVAVRAAERLLPALEPLLR